MDEAAAGEGIESMLHAAEHVLETLGETLWQVPSERLATVAGLLGQLAARAEAALVRVTVEAETRGVVALSQAKRACQSDCVRGVAGVIGGARSFLDRRCRVGPGRLSSS